MALSVLDGTHRKPGRWQNAFWLRPLPANADRIACHFVSPRRMRPDGSDAMIVSVSMWTGEMIDHAVDAGNNALE